MVGGVIEDPSLRAQVGAALAVLRDVIGPADLIGGYLFGSAVAGGLRPDSDIDLFAVTVRRLERHEKKRIVAGLLPLSGRATRPASWRPLELTIVAKPDVIPWRYPARMELLYGEWLRDDLVAGRIEPEPPAHADLGVLVAMVRERSVALVGPPAHETLAVVPFADLVRAMVDSVPALLEDLATDTRNVLLTLARIWTTLATRQFRSKDEGADWAIARLPPAVRPHLVRARDLYRNGGYGEWSDMAAVRVVADRLVSEIERSAARASGGADAG